MTGIEAVAWIALLLLMLGIAGLIVWSVIEMIRNDR